jgi:hypothetical protein
MFLSKLFSKRYYRGLHRFLPGLFQRKRIAHLTDPYGNSPGNGLGQPQADSLGLPQVGCLAGYTV